VDPQFKIIPAKKNDESGSESDDSLSDHELAAYVEKLNMTPQEPGKLLTPKQILNNDVAGEEITVRL
jgi:hypothetical protein